MKSEAGKVIFLHGASSAGKSTLARALQEALPIPFWHFSIDHFIDSGILPRGRKDDPAFNWSARRPAFFDGFHRCLPALLGAGNNLIVEHIIETQEWSDTLKRLLDPFDVFMVGLHCPLEELERRERERGDRRLGDARRDFLTIHEGCTYDLEFSSTDDLDANVVKLIEAWNARSSHSAWF